jgi:hypothetical protein
MSLSHMPLFGQVILSLYKRYSFAHLEQVQVLEFQKLSTFVVIDIWPKHIKEGW